MEVSALLAEYRRRADDRVPEYYVGDEEAMQLASEAEREACMRANLIFDDATEGVAVYDIASGQSALKVSSLVWHIEHATFSPSGGGRPRTVRLTGIDWLRQQCGADGREATYVEALAHVERTEVRLFPLPRVAGILRLQIYRLPQFALESLSDEPEIAEEHHDGLVDWMLYRTWSAKDSEQEDPARAAQALADFTARFGERPTADVMRRRRERRRVTTRAPR